MKYRHGSPFFPLKTLLYPVPDHYDGIPPVFLPGKEIRFIVTIILFQDDQFSKLTGDFAKQQPC